MVSPGNVPGHMDAKEMILAAIDFLASEADGELKLPLISTVQHQDDLEKRVYQKEGSWSLSDSNFLDKLFELETIFMEAPMQPIGRRKYCPNVAPQDELPLLMKGTIPASATAKKRGATAKRKTPTPTLPMEDVAVTTTF